MGSETIKKGDEAISRGELNALSSDEEVDSFFDKL